MVKKILLLVVGVFVLALPSQAKPPKWVSKLPMPDNDTYYYRSESATGDTEEQARNKALAKVMQNANSRVGVTINNSAVNDALRTGSAVKSDDCALIGINPVCSYSEKIEGGYRYYILCQISSQAPTEFKQPNFTTFRNCGQQSSTDVLEVDYPSEWSMYDTDEYIASFKREHYARGEVKQTQAIASLLELAERDLRTKLGIDEGDYDFRIYADSKDRYIRTARSDGEDAFVVYYISREQLLKYYHVKDSTFMVYVQSSIDRANEYISQAQELDEAANEVSEPDVLREQANLVRADAEMELQFAQQQLHEAMHYTGLGKAYGADVSEEQALQTSIDELLTQMLKDVQGNAARTKKQEKVSNYIKSGVKAQKDMRISEALKYYYWAFVMHKSIDPSGSMQYENQPADKWLSKRIKDILKAITFSYAGESPDDPSMGMVNVFYQKKPVKSLDYRYYTNIGWSEAFRAKDGLGVIRFYENENEEKKLVLKIEYVFLSEASIDKEIALLLDNNLNDFTKEATKELNLQKIVEKEEDDITLPIDLNTENLYSASQVKEGKYAGAATATILSQEDSRPYSLMIDNICEALTNRQANKVLSYFTPQGKKWFVQLTKSGRITIIDKNNVNYIRIGDNIVARSVKMSFEYKDNHKTFVEDVVFEFNNDKKIQNLRYMLERSTIDSISKRDDWSDAAKLALVDFLEKYKSSYALRDTSYLQRVFDDNALIIVGKVNKTGKDHSKINFGRGEYVEYRQHTKKSFLTNLDRIFRERTFVNLALSDLYIMRDKKFDNPNMYGLRLKQDYSNSSGYGDQGYLFLLMDLTDYETPIIYVRTWQEKPDYKKLPGNGLFGPSSFK